MRASVRSRRVAAVYRIFDAILGQLAFGGQYHPLGDLAPMLPSGRHPSLSISFLTILLVVSACGQPASSTPRPSDAPAGQVAPAQATGPRGTLKIAYPTEPETLNAKFGSGSGLNEFNWI